MKVIEKLGKSDGIRLVFSRLPEGKIKVTSQLWPEGVVVCPTTMHLVQFALEDPSANCATWVTVEAVAGFDRCVLGHARSNR
jgi:hypothetical protein